MDDPTRAQTAFVLNAGGDDSVSAGSRLSAVTVVEQVLVASGMTVVQAPPQTSLCADSACLQQLLTLTGADDAFTVTLWAEGGGGRVTSVLAALEGGAEITTTVEGDDVERAARQGATRLLSARTRGDGPLLRVSGSPEGAIVLVDGTEMGPLPWEGAVRPGLRSVRVRLSGYEEASREVSIPDAIHAQIETRVELARPGSAPGAASTASEWNYVIAGVLGAGAIGLAVTPIWTAATAGQSVGTDRVVDFGGLSTALAISSAVCLVGALVVVFAAPLRVTASASPTHAAVGLTGSFC